MNNRAGLLAGMLPALPPFPDKQEAFRPRM